MNGRVALKLNCVGKLLLLAAASLALAVPPAFAQQAAATPAPQLAPIAPTISLGEPIRSTKLESDDPEIRYENGFFFNADASGHILIRNKDGHITGDFNLSPLENGTVPPLTDTISPLLGIHDVAIFKDGSIVASWIYMLPHDNRRYFYLVHYDQTGKFLEQIDLGTWRALRLCIADDKSIWTLSGEDKFGHPVYSPDEGVLRNYKFGSGLVRAVVPRSNFEPNNNYSFPLYSNAANKIAIDCSGDKVHALTGDGQWIEYTPGADFTITKIDEVSRSAFGGYWKLSGFAYLDNGHAYAVIHSGAGDPFKRILAELLPSKDGKSLHWAEIPEKALPANNQPPDAVTPPGTVPKEPIAVTTVLGADHENGEQLVYRTSKDESVLWSKPLFGSAP
jgi:hypothetical protein